MIYSKQLLSPALRRRTVTRRLSLYKEKSGALVCGGVQFREEGGALVCAEGAEKKFEILDPACKFFTSSGQIRRPFCYCESRTLFLLDDGTPYAGIPDFRAVAGYEKEGENFFGVNREGLYLLSDGSYSVVEGAKGGDCICVSCERLIVAQGQTVRWSKPLFPGDWTESLREAGYVDLPSPGGRILSMQALGGRVLLIRENGLCALTMRGDPLAFCAENVPYGGGRIVPDSAALCKDKIVFLAEDGLYAFDGSRAKRLSGCGFSQIAPQKGFSAVSAAGKYYAAVETKDGEKRIWVVEPEEERGHFLRMRAEMLAGGERLLFLSGNTLYALTDCGIPEEERRECALDTERSLLGLSPRKKYLDGVSVEGEGSFRVEARAEKGAMRAAEGRAGERLLFPVPVSGTSFSFHITTPSERARIKSLTFELREETGTW